LRSFPKLTFTSICSDMSLLFSPANFIYRFSPSIFVTVLKCISKFSLIKLPVAPVSTVALLAVPQISTVADRYVTSFKYFGPSVNGWGEMRFQQHYHVFTPILPHCQQCSNEEFWHSLAKWPLCPQLRYGIISLLKKGSFLGTAKTHLASVCDTPLPPLTSVEVIFLSDVIGLKSGMLFLNIVLSWSQLNKAGRASMVTFPPCKS